MRSLKKTLQRLVRSTGFDVVRLRKDNVEIGIDPLADMRRFLADQPELLILDVGANVGQSVERFMREFPGASIHSFEPSPTTYQKLQENCKGLRSVKTWNCGVGSKEATLAFQENKHPDMSSFLAPGTASWGEIVKSTEVRVITLDAFAEEQGLDFIHVLKSDTQGYDFEVFKGASRLMDENRIALVYFEFIFSDMYQNLPPFDEVFRYLTGKGFDLVTFYEAHFQDEVVGWTDCLFINREFRLKRKGTGSPAPAPAGGELPQA